MVQAMLTDSPASVVPAAATDARPRIRHPWLIRLSFALHVAVLALVLAHPDWAMALLGALVANHAVLIACGLLPRNDWLGENWSRLPAAAMQRREVALTFDDGPDPAVTPAVLDLLDRHAARATFFCVGDTARAHPALCAEIARRGHAVENHSQSHQHHFSLFGPRALAREVKAAQATLGGITGERPRFFRAPVGLRNPFVDGVLQHAGLTLVSWTQRAYDTRVGDPNLLMERLSGSLAAGDIVLLHDGHAARTAQGEPAILEVLPRLLERLRQLDLRPVTLREAAR